MKDERISTEPGNSPLAHVPEDYYPKNCGFWFQLNEGRDAGKKMFFRKSNHLRENPENTIVFVHGNPECSYTYRHIISELEEIADVPYQVVSMDHIGFGLSDQASFEMVCMDHSKNLRQLVKYLDLQNVTLVVHDWGGPTGIETFLRESGRISNLVILNSTVFPIPSDGYTYNNYPVDNSPWASYPDIISDEMWGIFASYAIFRTPIDDPGEILDDLISYSRKVEEEGFTGEEADARRVYKEQFDSEINTKSSKRLVRQAGVWATGNTYEEPRLGTRDTSSFYEFIQENISKEWGPEGQDIGVRALVGRWDPLGKESVLSQWIDHLPQLEGNVEKFQEVGHFVEERKPKEIAESISELIGE